MEIMSINCGCCWFWLVLGGKQETLSLSSRKSIMLSKKWSWGERRGEAEGIVLIKIQN
jgi:hypothetical protein